MSVPGEVRTGALGFVDPHGRLHVVGRAKERYVRGGYNIYPMEIESALAGHPAIAAIAVFGRDDPVMGEVGVAVAVARRDTAGPTIAELRSFGGERLAAYKLPDELVIVDALPLTAADKVDRAVLPAVAAATSPARPDAKGGSVPA